jgi:hypothetical protein
MKIALCFSGQPRFVSECSEYIKQNVIRDYDVDVFAHLWFDEELQSKPYKYGGSGNWVNQRIPSNAVGEFTSIYNPVSIVVEKSKKFVDSKLHFETSLHRYWPGSIDNPSDPDYRNRTINNCLSYFYSLNEVNKLKKLHEYENDFKYDWVIRCRTDSMVQTKMQYNIYNQEVINFTGIMNQPDGMINDWFNFGGSDVMDAFMSVFPVSQLIFDKCMRENQKAWCHELLHRKMVDCFEIDIQAHPIMITLPRF